MSMLFNSDTRYGAVTKLLHWTVFLLFLNQFVVAAVMLTMEGWEERLGITGDGYYQWHKSVGVVVFFVALIRFIWRKTTPLPDWAPNLSGGEKRAIHRIERVLYLTMFLMPLSGFVFVMAGGYPLNFFGLGEVPNLIGEHPALSTAAQWTHHLTAVLIGAALLSHWFVVARHQIVHRDRYPHRILPFTEQ
jgi:cytochrome b561